MNRRFFLVCILIALLPGCSATKLGKQNAIQAYLDDALRQAQIDRMAQARQAADRALAVDPADVNTYVRIARTAPVSGALDIATVFQSVGDDPTLADYMSQAIRQFPAVYQPYVVLKEAQIRLGRRTEAQATAVKLAALLEANLKKPGTKIDGDLYATLAQAYCDAGNTSKGIEDYRKATRAYPDDPTPLNNLAYVFAVADSKPNLAEARTLAGKAIALAQKQNASEMELGTYQDTLGWVQYRQGDFKGAETSLLNTVSALPRLPEVRYHLAMTYLAQGKTDAARAEFGHAVQLSKGYADAQRELSRLPPTS